MNWYVSVKTANASHYYPRLVATLNKYKAQGLWLHISDIPKIGINTKPSHRDPIGIYFFPLDHMSEQFTKYHYWSFRKYLFVCKITPRNALDITNMPDEQVDALLNKHSIPRQQAYVGEGNKPEPGKDFWESVERHSQQKSDQAGKPRYNNEFRNNFVQMGFDAIRDRGTGTIHSNEPDQLVVLDPSIIQVVEMVEGNSDTKRPSDSGLEYAQNKKYPFDAPNTRPAIELLNATFRALEIAPNTNPQGRGKGQWSLGGQDQKGNKIRIAIELHRGYQIDHSSFRVNLSASWHSDGKECYFSDTEENSTSSNKYEFNIHTPYDQIIAPFVAKLKIKMQTAPMDDTTHVAQPLQLLAKALNGKVELQSPVWGDVKCKIGQAILKINVRWDSGDRYSERGYHIGGIVNLPKSNISTRNYYDPSFGQGMRNDYQLQDFPRTICNDIAVNLSDVLQKHFGETKDIYRTYGNEFVRANVTPIITALQKS